MLFQVMFLVLPDVGYRVFLISVLEIFSSFVEQS